MSKRRKIQKKKEKEEDPVSCKTKDTCVRELYLKFYGAVTNFERRRIEKENLNQVGDALFKEDFRFIELCNILVPNELIILILSFLPRNLDVLCKVGRITKHVYLVLISTWKELFIMKLTNEKGISLLALRNVKKITIYMGFRTSDRVSQSKMQYLWKLLNPSKMRELIIRGKHNKFVLNGIKRLQSSRMYKEVEFPLQNITKLSLKDLREFKVNDLFPNLQDVQFDDCSDQSFKGCKNLHTIRKVWDKNFIQTLLYPVSSSSSNITSLHIKHVMNNSFLLTQTKDIESILTSFKDLESLTFDFTSKPWPEHHHSFLGLDSGSKKGLSFDLNIFETERLSQLQPTKKLKKLAIIVSKKRSGFSYYNMSNDIPFQTEDVYTINFPTNLVLDEFQVYSTKRSSERSLENDLDICLEDMYDSNFFMNNQVKLNWDLKIPLLSRKNRFYSEKFPNDDIKKKLVRDVVIKTIKNLLNFIVQITNGLLDTQKFYMEVKVYDDYFQKEKLIVKMDRNNGIKRIVLCFEERCKFEGDIVLSNYDKHDKRPKKYTNIENDDEIRTNYLLQEKSIIGLVYYLFYQNTIKEIISNSRSIDVLKISHTLSYREMLKEPIKMNNFDCVYIKKYVEEHKEWNLENHCNQILRRMFLCELIEMNRKTCFVIVKKKFG